MKKTSIVQSIDKHLKSSTISFLSPPQSPGNSLHSKNPSLPSFTTAKSNEQSRIEQSAEYRSKHSKHESLSNLLSANTQKSLTNFYVKGRRSSNAVKNSFYTRMAIANGFDEHNLYKEGIKDSPSVAIIMKDIDVNKKVLTRSRQKFAKLEHNEMRLFSSQDSSDVRQFMKDRKEVEDLLDWIKMKFNSIEPMPSKQIFNKKLSIIASAFGELTSQVSRDCKERGILLNQMFNMILEIYHQGFNFQENENFNQSEEYLKQQSNLHRVYQEKLQIQGEEILNLKKDIHNKMMIVERVVKDDRYLRKKVKKLERLLRQQYFDMAQQKKEYAELYKENVRLLMRHFDIDEQTAKELKREYKKITEEKIASLNFKVIDSNIHKQVDKQFTDMQVHDSVRNYAELQDMMQAEDDLSDNEYDNKHVAQIADKGTSTQDLYHQASIAVDTTSLILLKTQGTQYRFEVETNSIGVQESVKQQSKFTNTQVDTHDQETQAAPKMENGTSQTTFKRSTLQIDEDMLQQMHKQTSKKNIPESYPSLKELEYEIELPENPLQQIEDDLTKIEERNGLIVNNNQTLLKIMAKSKLESNDIQKIQMIAKTNEGLTQELYDIAQVTLNLHKRSLALSSEQQEKLQEQNQHILRQQIALDFLKKDMTELQQLNAEMDSPSKKKLYLLIEEEIAKLKKPTHDLSSSSPANMNKEYTAEDYIDDGTEIESPTKKQEIQKKTQFDYGSRLKRQSELEPKKFRTTQVVQFNFSEKKKKTDKFALQAEHQHRASQLMQEAASAYQPSQLIMKNKVKILTTLIKNMQPLFSDLFRMVRKGEEFRFPIFVFLYTSFINKFGLMKVSEKNFILATHQLYQCQSYTPALTFLAQLMGLNINENALRAIPKDKNQFSEMLGAHGYIQFFVFRWLVMLDESNGQNIQLERMTTSASRVADLLNRQFLGEFDANQLKLKFSDIANLQVENNPFTDIASLVVPGDHPINTFSVGCVLHDLACEMYKTYYENIQYVFNVFDKHKINFTDFKTALDTIEPKRKRQMKYADLLISFIEGSDTTDDIEKQYAMSYLKLSLFCWVNRIFSTHALQSLKAFEGGMGEHTHMIKSFKWYLFQNNQFNSSQQKLLNYLQKEEQTSDVVQYQLCQYILLTKIENVKTSHVNDFFLVDGLHHIQDSFNKLLLKRAQL